MARHQIIRDGVDNFTGKCWIGHDAGEDNRSYHLGPPGKVIVNDSSLLRSLAVQGMALIYTSDRAAEAELRQGLLVSVPEAFARLPDNLFLYYPARGGTQPKLRAFIDMAKALVADR